MPCPRYQEPFHCPVPEVPSIELVAKLVKVVLQEVVVYPMVYVQQQPLRIAYRLVDPWQHFVHVRRGDLVGGMLDRTADFFVGGIVVGRHVRALVDPRPDLLVYRLRPKVLDHLHLKVLYLLVRPVLFRVAGIVLGFDHDQDDGLFLAPPAALVGLLPVAVAVDRLEEALVQLDGLGQRMGIVARPHDRAYLVHHRPDGLVAVVAQLPLHLLGREALLGRGQQVHGDEPVLEGQLAGLHDRPRAQRGAEAALLALVAPFVLFPVVVGTTAFFTGNTLLVPDGLELELAALLVGVLFVVVQNCHIFII